MALDTETVDFVASPTAPADPTAPTRAPSRVRRLVDSWAPLAVIVALPPVLVGVMLRPVSDPDTFWHLSAGRYLRETGNFQGADPFSSFSTNPWVLHEWLPELVASLAADRWGLPAVAWLAFMGILTLFAALFLLNRGQGTAIQGVIGTLAAVIGASGSLSPRPQMVTFILLAVTVGAWLRTARDHRVRWWLVPLTWLWACSHGMWFTGVIVGLVVILGLLLDRSVTARAAIRLATVPVLSVVAAALTPVGPGLLLAPLAVSDYTKYVAEWDAPSLKSPSVAVTVTMLVVVAVLWARARDRVTFVHLGLWVVALGWTLLYARTVAVGAIMAAPLLVCALNRLNPRAPSVDTTRRAARGAVVIAVVLGGLLAAVVAPSVAASPGMVPSGLDARLDALPKGTVVFDEYELGGWLIWRHPGLKSVIDGRTEVFSLAYLDDYMVTRGAGPGWERTIDATGSTQALVAVDSPLGNALQQVRGWTVTGRDSGYVLLAAP